MSRFLFTTLPTNDLGLLTRSLPIARLLACRGHQVQFCSPAPAPARLVAEAGFDNPLPLHPLFDVIAGRRGLRGLLAQLTSRRWQRCRSSRFAYVLDLLRALPWRTARATPAVWDADHAGALMGMLNEGFVRANVAALKDLMAASAADVIVDFWNPFAVIAARALRLPVVTVIQGDAHPASRGFIWWKARPTLTPTPVATINRILATYGLPEVASVSALSVGDRTLVVGTPATDPLPAGSDVTYVGAVLWQQPGAVLPDWILSRTNERPLVWVYSGNPQYGSGSSWLDSKVVTTAAIAALANEPVDVILTTGHHALEGIDKPLPPNFRLEPYLPGLLLAKRCDLLIHHGGYGSCQIGLYCGTPAVIVPTFTERESNARRVQALGAALIVPVETRGCRRFVNAQHLRDAAVRILTDKCFAHNAARVGRDLRRYPGAELAATLIEEVAQRARQPGR